MTDPNNTAAAEGAQLVGTLCRPAAAGRPVRFEDPERNRRYWERIERNTAAAPPLSDRQKAVIRAAFSTVTTGTAREAA